MKHHPALPVREVSRLVADIATQKPAAAQGVQFLKKLIGRGFKEAGSKRTLQSRPDP